MRKATGLILLFITLMIAGCSRGAGGPQATQPPATPSAPAQPPSERPSQGVAAETLLPRADFRYKYYLNDNTTATEEYIRDGERLIGTYNGKTYVTWFITDQGVYRRDPKGTALLRFLPPVITGPAYWKQTSGDTEVWFALTPARECTVPGGQSATDCWELKMLNRGERLIFRLAPGHGIVHVESQHLTKPADSYTKQVGEANAVTITAREQMRKEGATRPADPLAKVTQVDDPAFVAADRAMAAKSGAYREIDLTGDGKPEAIEGVLGHWHNWPIRLFSHDGQEMGVTYNDFSAPHYADVQHRLDVATGPALKRPLLIYQRGRKGDTWHMINIWGGTEKGLASSCGWHPKCTPLWAAGAHVAADGTVVATGVPAEMGGYTWNRYFRLAENVDLNRTTLTATLVREELIAGPYPTQPAQLLTAAFVARWYSLPNDLARYIPDEALRRVLTGNDKLTRPPYVPSEAKVGTLSWKQNTGWPEPVPELTPGAPAPGAAADFLVKVGQYEGYNYWTGKVTFGKAPDGRLIVTGLTIDKTGFVY